MKEFKLLRWERINESNLSFDNIKLQIKKIYDYEISENNLYEFINNIDKYKNINEGILLSKLEDSTYNKLILFSIKESDDSTIHPILESFGSEMGKAVFKTTNRVNFCSGEVYSGELDNFYKITYYNDNNPKLLEIVVSSVKEFSVSVENEFGVESTDDKKAFDSVKFLIDFEKNLVFMFYKDIDISINKNKDVTSRKNAFMKLFSNVSTRNLIKYDISKYLTKYFNEYLNEFFNNDPKKLISIIRTASINKQRSSLESIEENFNHTKSTLIAIKEHIDAKTHIISTLECKINSNNIRFKNIGEISLYDCTFQPEVMENVCNELFEGYNPITKNA